ncbi:diacylglycerol/polyprenol kinase family protein [Thermococcus henrietii]|uniref:diacylglycerol/polyprenol kinase family protein n=1 Tax=Thermococcus henrietii TaxID=2016361 RepID=UPI000C08A170|nr:diacylglycerol/polyprenol kinase family protein [Thermococcus henrietii]
MSIKRELKRKALHLTGLLIPAFYLLLGRDFTISFIGVSFLTFVVLEPFRVIEEWRDSIKRRLGVYAPPEVMSRIEQIENHIDDITRSHERNRVAAHIYFAAASFIVVYFFPKRIAIGAIGLATLGDALAAIIGKTFGKHRFSNGKSLEGSLAYFITGMVLLTPLVGPVPAFVGSLAGMIAEFYNLPPDDNFSNQLAVALALYVASFL